MYSSLLMMPVPRVRLPFMVLALQAPPRGATIPSAFKSNAIAFDLNAEGIVAPRGGAWSASTINGNRTRGTGIINNELYIGRLVWNRLAYLKDPETGRRRSRQRSEDELIVTDVPHLRLVPQDLWDAVRERQARLEVQSSDAKSPAGFWTKQRPRYLFSGLIRCGECGGGFSKSGAT